MHTVKKMSSRAKNERGDPAWDCFSRKSGIAMTGQTMIEVIIALTLIILFLAGVVVVELFAVKNAEFSRNKSISTQLARQQIERARVIRDSVGIDALTQCLFSCYINEQLSPAPVPTGGVYIQSLTIASSSPSDCPIPSTAITPQPVSYTANALVSWGRGIPNLTPAPEVKLSSCITDWR